MTETTGVSWSDAQIKQMPAGCRYFKRGDVYYVTQEDETPTKIAIKLTARCISITVDAQDIVQLRNGIYETQFDVSAKFRKNTHLMIPSPMECQPDGHPWIGRSLDPTLVNLDRKECRNGDESPLLAVQCLTMHNTDVQLFHICDPFINVM